MLPLLLKNVWRMQTADFRRGSSRRKRRLAARLLALTLLPTLIVLQTKSMFAAWLVFPGLGPDFLLRFISTSLFGLLFLLVFTGLPVTMQFFFLAPDLPLLLTLPLPKKAIFGQKFVEACISNLGMFVLIGLPLLISLCLALHASPLIYVIVVLASLIFITIPTALAGLLTFLLGRLFSIKKMRRVSTLLLAIFIIAAWASFQFLRLSRLNPTLPEFDPQVMQNLAAQSESMPGLMLPSDWLVNSVYSAATGDWIAALLYGIFLVVAGTLFAGAAIFWRFALDDESVRLEASARKKKNAPIVRQTSSRNSVFFSLLIKDLRLTMRDTRLLQAVLLLVAMMLVLPFIAPADGLKSAETLDLLVSYMPLIFLLMISAATLAQQNLAIERLSFSYLLTAPPPFSTLLLTKLLRVIIFLAPAVPISATITAHLAGTPPKLWLMITAALELLLVCGASVGQTFGVYASNFNWSDPRYMIRTSAAYLGPLATIIIGSVGIGIFWAGILFQQQIIAFLLFFIYVAAVFALTLWLSLLRLKRLDWTF